MTKDEGYFLDDYYFRSSIDRRFWHHSGRPPSWFPYGIVDDYGDVKATDQRPVGIGKALANDWLAEWPKELTV